MARERIPGGISSVEFRVFVKDPEADADSLFTDYVQVPGVGGVTLPAEESPSTDEVTLEGVGQATGFASPGTITVPLPRLTQHPAHRLLIEKQDGGGNVLVKLFRRASGVITLGAGGAMDTVAVAAAARGRSLVTVAGALSVASARPGHYLAVGAVADVDAGGIAAVVGDDLTDWRAVLSVDEDGQMLTVSPGVMVAVGATATSAANSLFVRQPGLQYNDLLCTVGTMARGEAAGSASVAGNLVLRPDTGLGTSEIVTSTVALAEVH